MAALKYPLELNQGEDVSIVFPVFDPVTNEPLIVDGWTAKSQVRSSQSSITVLYEWSAANNNITVAGTSVTLRVLAADTQSWTWANGRYDIELIDPSGKVTRIVEGTVQVSLEITR
jgi:hypothetical protein